MNGGIVGNDMFVRIKERKQRVGGSGTDGVNELFPLLRHRLLSNKPTSGLYLQGKNNNNNKKKKRS